MAEEKKFPAGRDPVFQGEFGGWWYYDCTWTKKNGPFDTENDARFDLELYCAHLNKGDGGVIEVLKEKILSLEHENKTLREKLRLAGVSASTTRWRGHEGD